MTREEAINKVRQMSLPKETMDILEALAPELKEGEDERIRNEILIYIGARQDIDLETHNRWCAYLEKQKDCFLVPKSHIDPVGEPGIDGMKIFKPGHYFYDGEKMHFCSSSVMEEKQKPMYNLEIPAGDVAPAEEDGPSDDDYSYDNDEKIRKSLIEFLTDIKEISESGRTSWAIRKDDAEMCKSFIDYLEKQKESLRDFIDDFPYSADSIPSDYMSDVKYENRWHEVKDSLPNSAREVLCRDAIGNFFIGRYYKSTQSWEVVMYDDCDKSNEYNPPVVEWCEIPSEKQKKQKLNPDKKELIRQCIGSILTDATDERFKDYGLTLKDCLTWLDEQKEQKPVEWKWPNLSNCIRNCKMCHGKCFYRKEPYEEQKPVKCIEFTNEFENQVSHLLASVLNGEYEYCNGFINHAAQSLLGYAKNEIRSGELDKIEKLMKALQATNAQIGELVEENYKLKEQKSAQSDAEKEYVRILKSIISDFVRDRMPKNTLLYQDIFDWLDGRHVEQKSDNYSEERKLNYEWTSEDWSMLCDICGYISGTGSSSGITNQERETWLRELPKRFSLENKEQEPVEIDEYEIIKKHITDDFLSSEVNKRLNECGWYVTDEKPAKWSKEDENHRQNCLRLIKMKLDEKPYPYYADYNWLKNLPKRFNSQLKQEWSGVTINGEPISIENQFVDIPLAEWNEEDEENISTLIEVVHERMGLSEKRKQYYEKWLKSLRHKPHTVSIKDATKFGNLEYERGVKDGIQSEKSHQWKPNEEQIGALNYAYCELFKREDVGHNILGSLQELLDNLKKL